MKFKGTRLSGRVEYIANLGSEHERLERCGNSKMFPYRPCYTLYRYGRPLTTFEAGPSQEKKIKAGRGRITITDKMIWRASDY